MLLSRVAERVYWQSRYLERTLNTSLLVDVFSSLQMDLPQGDRMGWRTLIEITGAEEAFAERYRQPLERNVVRFLVAERNGLSVVDMLAAARENARTIREIMPLEAFELINDLFHYARDNAARGIRRAERHELLAALVADCQQINGMLAGTMSRDAAYSFVRMGRALERADMTTRIIDAGWSRLLPDRKGLRDSPEAAETYVNMLWMNVLRSQSAYQMYRQHVRERVNAEDVVRFLLQNEEFPRSAAHNLTTVKKILPRLPNSGRVRRRVDEARAMVGRADAADLLHGGLFEYLDGLQTALGRLHAAVARTWFLPGG